jgi:hypothetical protein
MATLLNKTQLFRSLHVPGKPLILPNAWDAASDRAAGRLEEVAQGSSPSLDHRPSVQFGSIGRTVAP